MNDYKKPTLVKRDALTKITANNSCGVSRVYDVKCPL